MSPLFSIGVLARRRSVKSALLLVVILASLAVSVAGAESISFRRIFVPADSPESWPVGSELYLPIPRAEFARWIELDNAPAIPDPQIQAHLTQADYRAELSPDDVLQGRAELKVRLEGHEPRLLPLPTNLAIRSASWLRDPSSPATLGLWKQEGRPSQLAVLVEQSGTLQLDWQLAPRSKDARYIDFDLKTPPVAPQQLELQLPTNHVATLSSAELLDREQGFRDEGVWEYQLAVTENHRLRINRSAASSEDAAKPLVSHATSYELTPTGLTLNALLRVDARASKPSELRASLDSGLRIVEVLLDQQPVDWYLVESARRTTLAIPWAEPTQAQQLEIRGLAKLRADSNSAWKLPRIQLRDVSWTEGTTTLFVSPELELRSLTPSYARLQHIVGIADNERQGEVFRLQEWSDEASIEVEIGRPAPQLAARTAVTLELGRSESQASIMASFSNKGHDVYQLQAEVAGGWSIDSVSAVPKSALSEWHLDHHGDTNRLRLQLNQPISRESPLKLAIKARQIAAKSLLPATIQQLQLLRFLEVDTRRQLLELRTPKSQQLAFSDRMEKARLAPDQMFEEDKDLFLAAPMGTLLDISQLDSSQLIQFRQEPVEYTAEAQVVTEVTPDVTEHQFQIACRPRSGAVAEVVLELDRPLPAGLQWELAGQRGTVTAQRLESPTDAAAASDAPAKYLLRLSVPSTSGFRLQANFLLPAQDTERSYLINLPAANDWTNQIVLRGSLQNVRVLDQGWTPRIEAPGQVTGKLPVLGVYQQGVEEFQRRHTTAGLRLQRLFIDPSTAAPPLMAWLAEYRTLQAANGEALQIASYALENIDTSTAQIELPAGAKLQEVWIDEQQLEPRQIATAGAAYQFRLSDTQRWPKLVLKYSTHALPLGGSESIQYAVPTCNFPINQSRWTLWAPEQYEIDGIDQSHASKRYHWWKRLFGPLARSRGQTIFNPLDRAGWEQLWTTPLVGQQTKQRAERLARQLVNRFRTSSEQTWGSLLGALTEENQLAEVLFVDQASLLSKGIQATTPVVANSFARATQAQAMPLSSLGLALLVSPDSIVFTTTQRVAHWHERVRPTEISGVYMVNSVDLVDSLDEARNLLFSDLIPVERWQNVGVSKQTSWTDMPATSLADIGRRAQTVEFIDKPPALTVRRAFAQRALWYALVLFSLVVGIWQLSHYPNAMLLIGALAAAACFVVPLHWLTIPQAVFLGLLAAAIVRIGRRSVQVLPTPSFADEQLLKSVLVFLSLGLTACSAQAAEKRLPQVLLPVDAQGQPQGDDVYLPANLLEALRPSKRGTSDGDADYVLLSAKYRGTLDNDLTAVDTTVNTRLTDPWTLRWKIKTLIPNCRVEMPLVRGEALWKQEAQQLDGVPIALEWEEDGIGCAITVPEPGEHWLQLVAQPRVNGTDESATLQLHVPPLSGARLDLSVAHGKELRIFGATRIASSDTGDLRHYLIGGRDTLKLRWSAKPLSLNAGIWEQLEQRSWLRVEPATASLDVQLALTGLQSTSRNLLLDISPQLKIVPPDEDSAIEEVIPPTASQPRRLELKLRAGLPTDLVIPLRFDVQRDVSIGRLLFPEVRVLGDSATQNFFAVSVAAGLSYDETVFNNVRSIEPDEFATAWDAIEEVPLYAYALGPSSPDWSLRVWPNPLSFFAQQTLQVLCLPNEVQVDFEALVEDLTEEVLEHRIRVPESLRIESIAVHDQVNDTLVPVRWSRSGPTNVAVFLGQPLRQSHQVLLRGRIEAASDQEVELPQVHLRGVQRSELRMDLFRTEDVQVHWVNPSQAPTLIPQQRIPNGNEAIHIGHYSWLATELRPFSKMRLNSNLPKFTATSVTSVDSGEAGWTARLDSHVQIEQGMVSRLRLTVPHNFREPYRLQPAQIGKLEYQDQASPSSDTPSRNHEITVLLAQPAKVGEEIALQISGNLGLLADHRLKVPALKWNGATREERYLLLPTEVDGELIEWQTNGLRRHSLPRALQGEFSVLTEKRAYRIQQENFTAEERSSRGNLQKAQLRHSTMTATIGQEGELTTNAEFLFHPGRATSCRVALPPHSKLRQLVVGDQPVRREQLEDGTWNVPLGPPFIPSRIFVSYSTKQHLQRQRIELAPPKILLGNQALPAATTWWRIRPTTELQLGQPQVGSSTDAIQFEQSRLRALLVSLQDAQLQVLDLPLPEARVWLQTWNRFLARSELVLQAFELMPDDGEVTAAKKIQRELNEALQVKLENIAETASKDTYPPRLPVQPADTAVSRDMFFVSGPRGHVVVPVLSGSHNVSRWFAAVALLCGTLAVVLLLRSHPQWHYELCHWKQGLALVGGIAWWLLLQPSAIGLLVVALTLASMALQQWRTTRRLGSSQTDSQFATASR